MHAISSDKAAQIACFMRGKVTVKWHINQKQQELQKELDRRLVSPKRHTKEYVFALINEIDRA